MTIKSAGKFIYDTDNLHKVTFLKNLLEYSDDYSRSVATKNLWYLDTTAAAANANTGFAARRALTQANQNDGNGGAKTVSTIIPLNRYSFFEKLEDKMLVPMQLELNLQLQDSMASKYVESFLKPKRWKYSREMFAASALTKTSGFFRLLASIDQVKHVLVYLKNTTFPNNAQVEDNPYAFKTLADLGGGAFLSTCRLEYGNGVFYPETEYDTDFKMRIYDDVISYAMRENDFNSRTQLNTSNFNSLYGLIHFDLTTQSEKVTRDPKELIFRFKLSKNANADFAVNAVVLYDEQVVIDKVGNELVVV